MPKSVWEIRGDFSASAEVLENALDVPPIIARLLAARGINTPEQGRLFLSPSLGDFNDPKQMKGMSEAIDRLKIALRKDEKICIFGDYDVDGVTSVSVLLLFLRRVGFQAEYYIPSRMNEGYGLNLEAVKEIASGGTRLLITVDCGISDQEEVEAAREAGVDVIIIDHHQVPGELPPARAVLDPHQPGCGFPYKDMAAVGVTFSLIMALRAELRESGLFANVSEPNLREYLDLVALGTVADIVPLVEDNRIITHFGLEELTAGRRPGVAALKEISGILSARVSVGQVAFRLAPRINAVGRLGKASKAVEMLTTNSYSKALNLASELDRANSERQSIEHDIFDDASRLAEEASRRGDKALVLWSDDWHIGVVGIVASRLSERFGCPVVMIAMDGEEGKGSARGTEQVHLYKAMESSSERLKTFGGHKAAAGLTIRREELEGFREAFQAAIAQQVAGREASRVFTADDEVQPSFWDQDLVQSLSVLAPHGIGNPEPVFIARGIEVCSARKVGRDEPYHLKLLIGDGGRNYDAIGFSMGERLNEARGRLDLLYSAELNTWEGQTGIQLKLRDFRKLD